MTEVKRKGRPVEHDRGELLVAARSVAASKGFDALRFVDVSQATGVPISSLQYAFGSRDTMVREVIRHSVEEELERLRKGISRERTPWKQVARFIRLSISTEEQRRHEGWVLWMELLRAASRDAHMRREVSHFVQEWQKLVGGPISAGVRVGDFIPLVSEEAAAASIVALTDGLSLQVEAAGGGAGDTRQAIRTATRCARSLLGVADETR